MKNLRNILSTFAVSIFSLTAVASLEIKNHGSDSWPIIEKNVALEKSDERRASALPVDYSDWTSMSGWKRPKFVAGKISHRDFGIAMADFEYQIVLLYGGAPNSQKGKYIGYASIIAKDVSVFSGDTQGQISLNTEVVIKSVRNIGTAEEPIGEMTLELVSTLSRKVEGSSKPFKHVKRVRYLLTGIGRVEKISNSKPAQEKARKKARDRSEEAKTQFSSAAFSESRLIRGPKAFQRTSDLLNPVQLEPLQMVSDLAMSCPHPISPESGKAGSGVVGTKVDLVRQNKILDHNDTFVATALPNGVRCWNQLPNWHQERRGFEYRWVNRLWWDFVVEGEVVWLAGAQDRRQNGRYIGFVTVKINKVSRGIIKSLDISAYAPPAMVSNVGTEEDPVSSVTLVLNSVLRNGAAMEAVNWLVSVDGMGNISDVSREADQ